MGQPTRFQCRYSLAFALHVVLWSLATWAGGLAGFETHAATPPAASREYEVKAAALYNVMAFTEWPESAFTSSDAPLVIVVFGRGPIAGVIAELLKNESWRNRRLVLQRNPSPGDAKSAQVVFVSRTEQARWPFLRSQFAGRPILTVGDAEDFARQAGVVQLTIEHNKLHLAVNLNAARAAHLQISSKVLRLAEVIGAERK